MLDRPGGVNLGASHLGAKHAAVVQLIRPCLIGRKGLMRRSKLGAVGDAANTGQTSLSLPREDAAGVIGSHARH